MENTTRLLLPDVAEALRTDPHAVVELTEELHAADLADLAAALDDDLALTFVETLPVADAARLLESLDTAKRAALVERMAAKTAEKTAEVAEAMAPDERADLVSELPEEVATSILKEMEQPEAREVRQLLAYPESTAGALMTTQFVALRADETVAESIEHVRRSAAEMETIYDAYAVDEHGTLLGVVSLRDLVLARADRRISEIMVPNVITVEVDKDQEEAARLIAKYDLLALPVVDRNRIVGIITVDDVVDVIKEEAVEDVQRLGAVEPLEAAYFATPFLDFVRKRAPWLIILFCAGFLTTSAMRSLEIQFDKIRHLLWFVPLIIASGGNAGSQSASLMIRALAVGEVTPGDYLKVIGREIGIGLTLGLILALFGAGRAAAWGETRHLAMIATVCITVVGVVTLGAIIGSGLPLLLSRLGLDPAVSSTPFIASLSDVIGLLLYLQIATVLVF
jgi:magnesium transporter